MVLDKKSPCQAGALRLQKNTFLDDIEAGGLRSLGAILDGELDLIESTETILVDGWLSAASGVIRPARGLGNKRAVPAPGHSILDWVYHEDRHLHTKSRRGGEGT